MTSERRRRDQPSTGESTTEQPGAGQPTTGQPSTHPRRGYDTSWREAQAAATVCRIREAAADLFAHQGYADTTVTQVATHAGVSAESIYRRVGSKHDLLVDTIRFAFLGDAACTRLLDDPEMRELLESGPLSDLLDAVARCCCHVSRRLGPLWTAARAVAGDDVEDVLDRFATQRRCDLALVAQRIDHGRVAEILGRLIVATSFETYAQLVDPLALDPDRRVAWVQEQLRRIAGLEV